MFFRHIPRKFSQILTGNPEKTCLYNFHVENGGKIVNFGGFLLPVQYNDLTITQSHLHTRKCSSIFDVSHMLQTEIIGNDCLNFLEKLTTADLIGLNDNSSILTVFTNDNGGILDDLIITKITNDHFYVVSNAAKRLDDQRHLLNNLDIHKKMNPNSNVKLKFFEPLERSLLAIQGPKSMEILQKYVNIDLTQLYFMTSLNVKICQSDGCRITRCGYTGEDGFEISIPSIKTIDIVKELLQNNPEVRLAGLGARDSLRLEAGLCLYGNDITPTTTPVEANLTWLVSKRRRLPEMATFPGAHKILKQITDGVQIKRVGFMATKDGTPPIRHNMEIWTNNENNRKLLGYVTSGCPAPSLNNKSIGMGYIPIEYCKFGTEIQFKIRDKFYNGIVCKMPFVPSNYYSKPKI